MEPHRETRNEQAVRRLSVIDSHTCGEPTRVIVDGVPDLGTGTVAQKRQRLATEHDWIRRAAILEPRGSDILVGAVLLPPNHPQHVAGVIFFNNVGYLNMCGHGTIGVAVTLGHLGRIGAGRYSLETPVGSVNIIYDGLNQVTIENVRSYRYRANVRINVEDYGEIVGDIAWGGNWFFLVHQHSETLIRQSIPRLTDLTMKIRDALARTRITGEQGAEIDHIELLGPPLDPRNHGRSFVLCPGSAYDRSPCGTGTSAKLACLAADGKLAEGQLWRQESIIGSVFEATYHRDGDGIRPRITGEAFVTAESTLILDPRDPFRFGLPS
jgi:4-hydroxyproline epimerase